MTHVVRTGSDEGGSRRSWALLLPEALNGLVLAAPLGLCALATLKPYSDDAIRASLVDTYEPSAWAVLVTGAFVALGVLFAIVTYRSAQRSWRRRAAIMQVVLLIACLVLQAYAHHRVMLRTTALTGQTFAGFP